MSERHKHEQLVTLTIRVTIESHGPNAVPVAEVIAAWREFCGDSLLEGKELAEGLDLPANVSAQIVSVRPTAAQRQEALDQVYERWASLSKYGKPTHPVGTPVTVTGLLDSLRRLADRRWWAARTRAEVNTLSRLIAYLGSNQALEDRQRVGLLDLSVKLADLHDSDRAQFVDSAALYADIRRVMGL